MSQSLAIGWIYPGDVSGLFMQSVTNYILEDATRGKDARIGHGRGATIGLMSGPRIAHARNELVDTFLKDTKSEWLLMVDSDMVFTPKDIDTLFEVADPTDVPIVGGLCFGATVGGNMFPTLYIFRNPEDTEDGQPVQKVWDYPDYGLCEVDGTGAAFLLMHRDTLVRIGKEFAGPAPWFIEGSAYKGMVFGEDMAFCARAKSLEIPIHVHTGAKIGHVKPQIMDEHAYKAMRARSVADGGAEDTAKRLKNLGLVKV